MKSRVFIPALVSALLLWLAFFPVDFGPIAFVALVPLLTLVRAEGIGRWRRYGAAFLGGLLFSALAVKWIRVAHPMMALFAWPTLSVYCALYWPAAIFFLRRLDRFGRPPLALTAPIVWVALEYFRAHFVTGFPFLRYIHAHQLNGFGWYFLGYTQHHVLPLIQAADLGGVYLVSALVAAVNGAVYAWLRRIGLFRRLLRKPEEWQPGFTREMAVLAGVSAFGLALFGYGLFRLSHPPFPVGPRVHALQGNLSQSEKIIRGDQAEDTAEPPLVREYFPLAARAYGNGIVRRPDLIIWPETCFADDWYDAAPGGDTPLVQKAVTFEQTGFRRTLQAQLPPANLLLGLNRRELEDVTPVGDSYSIRGRKYNAAILMRDDPERSFGGAYDKIHLVPFGEYVPLKDWLPWLQQFTPYTHDYSCTPGENWTRFELPTRDRTYRFGVLICYEDSDPYLARQYNPAAGGTGVDFLVNISNDGWFDGTEQHEQHLAICRFRAIEARRSVVRAVNMGISATIDPDGRVIALPADTWSHSKKTAGIVRCEVPIDDRNSVYAAAGDWLPGFYWAIIAVCLLNLAWVRFRKKGGISA
ncbi:MAG: apolipoprotein N-acyltransferase [Bacteroidales bacterium]|nr:apolipoprotein N-acyltransferase [Bacteroidales bacterium]